MFGAYGMRKEKLAKIQTARLDMDRDIMSFWITVDYEDGFGQGIGGYALDTWDPEKKRRVGTAFGCEIIRRILSTFEVNDLSQLKGKMCWVMGTEDKGSLGFRPESICPLYVDYKKTKKPINFSQIFEELNPQND